MPNEFIIIKFTYTMSKTWFGWLKDLLLMSISSHVINYGLILAQLLSCNNYYD
jgi:hypothetical protein